MTPTEQFITDMEAAGFEVEHYHGRFFWHGPAVRVSDPHDVIRATAVRVQHDSLGLRYVVYPVVGEPGLPSECSR